MPLLQFHYPLVRQIVLSPNLHLRENRSELANLKNTLVSEDNVYLNCFAECF